MFDFLHRLFQQDIEQEQQTNELESLNRFTENCANEAMHQAESAASFAEDSLNNFFDNNMFGGGFGDTGMF